VLLTERKDGLHLKAEELMAVCDLHHCRVDCDLLNSCWLGQMSEAPCKNN
jgi:hypothetical protein